MMASSGVLLINLGTPDAPRVPEVRRYLRQFLSDRHVIDLNPIARKLLLELVILPRRPKRSAEAYSAIWTPAGSPLLVHGRALLEGVRAELEGIQVELGMRYGNPSIPSALEALRAGGCERVVVLSLYPQHAASTSVSSAEAVAREAARLWSTPHLHFVPAFHADGGYLDAMAEVARPVLGEFEPDRVLFSFHGLPERHVRRDDPSGSTCLADEACCAELGPRNRGCYRAQCFATARDLRPRLGLEEQDSPVAFQSRLGRTPWIGPHTDTTLTRLAREGARRLAVLCPSFVADCLETLEEIGLRAAEEFRAAGGEELRLVPALNAHPSWVRAAAGLLRPQLGE